MQPITLKDGNIVPCSNCPTCRAKRVSSWSFRLKQHEKTSKSSFFVTLTYSTQFVPLCDNGLMTLDKRDCQLYFKKLRKANPLAKLSYYLAAEYGTKSKRPHYHIILFDVYNIDSITNCWEKGAVHIGTVSGASIGYTLKYISKPKMIPQWQNDP